MPPFTTSHFPDINVWVALTYEGHTHHSDAAGWVRHDVSGCDLRLLPIHATRFAAIVDGEGGDARAEIESRFRALTRLRQPATKDWADSYLAAFAAVGQLTLVTFDRGLRSRSKPAIVLGP